MEAERTYIKFTAAEFIAVLKGGYMNTQKEDGKGYYTDRYGKGELVVVFDGIEVDEYISFDGDRLSIHEFFRTISNIYINNSKIKSLNFNVQKTGLISFTKTIVETINISDSEIEYIGASDSEIGYIRVGGKVTIKGFTINTSTVISVNISNSIVLNSQIINSKVDSIIIDKSTTKDWTFEKSKFIKLHFKNVISGKIHLLDSYFSDIFNIDEDSEIYSLIVQAKELRRLLLRNSYFQILSWKQDTFCIVNVESCQIEMLYFQHTAIPKDSVFQFIDCQMNVIRCILFVNTAWFNVSNLSPLINYKRFSEKSYDYNGEIYPDFNRETNSYRRDDIKKSVCELQFINSDFGKTSFVDCKLNKFDNFVFYNSKLLDIFVAGTSLPTSVTLPKSVSADEKSEQERLAFGQFKKIYENRGDAVSAADYLVLEMDAYATQLCEERVIQQRGGTLAERFAIYLNKVSSNHGTNWWRAVWVTLLVNSVCFFVYCQLQGYWFGSDYNKAIQLASYSFEYLNPLRKADFLDKKIIIPALNGVDWLARFWDYFSRIVVAYFVYQTIQAFRRFGKTK